MLKTQLKPRLGAGLSHTKGRCMMPPTITLRITDNADKPLASMKVPVPLSGEPGEGAMFDAEKFELLLDKGCWVLRKVFDEVIQL